MAMYWSSPIRRVERSMTAEARVAASVSMKQNEASSSTEDEVWSKRFNGVSRRREKRFDTARLSTNLTNMKLKNNNSFLISYLLLRVRKPLLLKKMMMRTVLRMVPIRKVTQIITSKTTMTIKSLLYSSSDST